MTNNKNGNITHGLSRISGTNKKTPTYQSWISMKSRVKNKQGDSDKYEQVGMCSEWEIFENFLKDMGERPEGTTLDRIDTSLGYYKENCRWADLSLQSHNRSKCANRSTSIYKGVHYDRFRNKWKATICKNYKIIFIGRFETEIEAAIAYNKKATQLYGNLASLNIIDQEEQASATIR